MRYSLLAVLLTLVVQGEVAAATPLKIILRYDDYSRSSNADVEKVLFNAAKSISAGILVGVIPFSGARYPAPGSRELPLFADLDQKKIDLLRAYTLGGTVHVSIHGYSHKNNAIQGVDSEFAGLPESEQALLLGIAKGSLETAVGLRIDSFTPPYSRYDSQTLRALTRNGYKSLFAGLGGPTLQGGTLNYLPGGPYPQRLKDAVLSALSKRHTDALIICSMHPYDFLESGVQMADFRRGSPQMGLRDFIDDLRQMTLLEDVRYISIRELFESGEDLSADRWQANLKLNESFVTRHHLLPESLRAYPLTGLYFSQAAAKRMYFFQISASALMYGALTFITTLVARALTLRVRTRGFAALASAVLAGAILAALIESVVSGFYMTSAIGLTCCVGVLFGIVFGHHRRCNPPEDLRTQHGLSSMQDDSLAPPSRRRV